jgi:hypothetical protein
VPDVAFGWVLLSESASLYSAGPDGRGHKVQ